MPRSLLMLVVIAAAPLGIVAAVADPFDFLQPTVIISPGERQDLDRGHPISRIVPGRNRQVAVLAAVSTRVGADRLVAWTRQVDQLKKSRYVEATVRFSDPPRIEDLAQLILDDDDLADIRRCRPGRCALKLASGEMAELRLVADEAGPRWKTALQEAFRRVVLRRVHTYLAGGHAALPPLEDDGGPTPLDQAFARLMRQSVFLTRSLPSFADYLERFPRSPVGQVESFVYWSKERLARKALVSAVHVGIIRHEDPALPDVVIAGKGIFATRHLTASLGITSLVRGEDGRRYIVYLNRSEVDALGGFQGGLVRLFVERRLRGEADDVLDGVRLRIEGGEPSPAVGAKR